MLIILTTHPIQYQVPLWQALARDGRVSFEVWYLTRFGTQPSPDREFGKTFAWDIDMLSGYSYRFLSTVEGASPTTFWKCRLRQPLRDQLRAVGATELWIQGWQVAGYWQAVWEAQAAGVAVWLRAESNDLAPTTWWKEPLKRIILGAFFKRVREFLYIGKANKRLYEKYRVSSSHLHPAPYAVDNERFAQQRRRLRSKRTELRRAWGILPGDYCVLFCGKFVGKKRPAALIAAARQVRQDGRLPNIRLLFVGAGELGDELKSACTVVYDVDESGPRNVCAPRSVENSSDRPPATFTGFLNQTEISRAYVAADCLVLPSDHGETWGLVVNEALSSGLPCVVSDACGCAQDLIAPTDPELIFDGADTSSLARAIVYSSRHQRSPEVIGRAIVDYSFSRTVRTVVELSSVKNPSAAQPCLSSVQATSILSAEK
jgi:glycosyltransferase involved in cell wall biosynthesis